MIEPTTPFAGAGPATESRLRRHLRRAETYQASGQREAAVASCEAALAIDPEHVGTLLQLAELHLQAARHNEARALVLRAVSGHLESPKLALQLVVLLNRLTETSLIVDIARQLAPPMWDSAKSLAEMAQQLSLVGAHALADTFARAGVERDPRHPPSLYVLATSDVFHGRMEAAVQHAERCLDILPGDAGSHWLLSRLRLPGPERRVERIERQLARGPTTEEETWLAYALHNELHDMHEHDRAWAALERGCRAKRQLLGYDPAASAALFEALHAWSGAELASGDGHRDPTLAPIFIIGMHRSGTTLAERILSGHADVAAGGETYDITAQLRRASGYHCRGETELRVVEARAGFDYRRIGEGYLHGVRWRSAGKPLMTDKLPSNFLNVGIIARALPQARFIHLRRDPVDVGLSNLRTLFSHACPYSYDQDDFVAYHGQYRKLMAHWHALLPGRILDVDYDAMVNAPEATAQAMARFCGLEYQPAMVRIEKRSDAVATASSVMMRDGIRRDRGKLWKVYEQQLQPMIRGLTEAG